MASGTFITVLGSSACKYDIGGDSSSYLINNRLIVDTGWHVVRNIQAAGLEPAALKTVLFTHMHHDHYLALPQLLFYWASSGAPMDEFTLIGPHELGELTRRAMAFLQAERFFPDADGPRVKEILPGETVTLERERMTIEAWRSVHPVDGRYYRVTDADTGARIGLSGDTAYSRDEGAFFAGCDTLVHESALGGVKGAGASNSYLHSDAEDAARVAVEAGVRQLVLNHYYESTRQQCADAARRIFGGVVLAPVAGDVVRVEARG